MVGVARLVPDDTDDGTVATGPTTLPEGPGQVRTPARVSQDDGRGQHQDPEPSGHRGPSDVPASEPAEGVELIKTGEQAATSTSPKPRDNLPEGDRQFSGNLPAASREVANCGNDLSFGSATLRML
jgi:hypothetical protein